MPGSSAERRSLSRTGRISRDLKMVLAVSRNMNLQRDLGALLDMIMRSATDLVKADRTSLFVVDGERGELWTRIAQDSDEIRLPIGSGIAGAVARNGAVINIPDAYADPRFNPDNDRRTGYRTRSILCMPLINHEGAIVGVIQALNKRGEAEARFKQSERSRFLRTMRAYERIIMEPSVLHRKVVQHGVALINAAYEYGDLQTCHEILRQFAADERLGPKDRSYISTMSARVTAQIEAGDEAEPVPFSGYDEEVLGALCAQAAVAIDNTQLIARDLERQQLLRDMQLAQSIQLSLLPETPPLVPGWRLAHWQIPCDQTSGDYHDFIQRPGRDGCDIIVGDVSGHGIGAALLMSTARAFLIALYEHVTVIEHLLDHLNRLLELDMADDVFMTMSIARIAPDGSCRWASAGHEAPMVYRAAERRIEVPSDETGLMLGALTDVSYESWSLPALAPGDLLLMMTDGLFEVCNEHDEELGLARIQATILDHAPEGAEAVAQAVRALVAAHRGDRPAQDDLTLVVAEYGG